MKIKHVVLVSLVVASIVSVVGQVTKNQAATEGNPAAIASMAHPDGIAQAPIAPKSTARSGSFVSGEHSTQGKVQLVNEAGKAVVKLDQGFKTSDMGPDLVVILHRSRNVIGSTQPPAYPLKSGDYIILAPLKKFSGAQEYVVPATVKLADYNSVAIWCRKFNATFGSASLQ